jgi:hypothetical protein
VAENPADPADPDVVAENPADPDVVAENPADPADPDVKSI